MGTVSILKHHFENKRVKIHSWCLFYKLKSGERSPVYFQLQHVACPLFQGDFQSFALSSSFHGGGGIIMASVTVLHWSLSCCLNFNVNAALVSVDNLLFIVSAASDANSDCKRQGK